ncbi:sodium:alanine symporter family protein, partial [Clostridium perfringens]
LYILGVMLVLVFNYNKIPESISLIIRSAFNPEAALGGAAGITISIAMQRGIGRGVFSNEAGLGSAPIAAAAARTKSPVRQGLISMTGTFIDTIIICTMTGLVIVITGSFNGNLEGAALTTAAFENGLPIATLGKYIVNIGLIFFAFTTIL